MSEAYETLKSLSEAELIDRYNSQAQFTVGSLDLYLEELRHREICGLLEALRGGLAESSKIESCLEMIELLRKGLLHVLESAQSVPPDVRSRAMLLGDRAKALTGSMRIADVPPLELPSSEE